MFTIPAIDNDTQFDRIGASSHECSTCGAKIGDLCQTITGNVRRPHMPRVRAALGNPPKAGERWLYWDSGMGPREVTITDIDATPEKPRLAFVSKNNHPFYWTFKTPDLPPFNRGFAGDLIKRL